ncbi:MAG: hypothetical protein LPK09_11465 [Hymenobacteraceae bacterium]|nr:hypothetical protein [Hymenobacteraceae bacterium]
MKTKDYDADQSSETAKTVAQVASGIGIGLVSGLAGTLVMTAAQMIQMRISGREPSDTPYKAVKKTFGVEAQSDEDKELITNAAHFAYGTTWGIPRGLMAQFGAGGVVGSTAHFGAVWGTELSLLPSMEVMEPITKWKPKAIAVDMTFHALYALATGITADALVKWLHNGKSSS